MLLPTLKNNNRDARWHAPKGTLPTLFVVFGEHPDVAQERLEGIEPSTLAWKAKVIPFYDSRNHSYILISFELQPQFRGTLPRSLEPLL